MCWASASDAPYEEIPAELKRTLTEYYRVNDLGNYGEMVRAVGYFTFRYGKIDWLESNNEYWLEMDAQLRTDFNITTGAQNDFISRIKYKSIMKESYRKAGVPVARHHMVSTLEAAREFIAQVGYPVIVKPDNGLRRRGHLQAEKRAGPGSVLRPPARRKLHYGGIHRRHHRQL